MKSAVQKRVNWTNIRNCHLGLHTRDTHVLGMLHDSTINSMAHARMRMLIFTCSTHTVSTKSGDRNTAHVFREPYLYLDNLCIQNHAHTCIYICVCVLVFKVTEQAQRRACAHDIHTSTTLAPKSLAKTPKATSAHGWHRLACHVSYVCVCLSMCMNACMCVWMYACVSGCMHVCLDVCIETRLQPRDGIDQLEMHGFLVCICVYMHVCMLCNMLRWIVSLCLP
jgi:hypothetical protein